MAGRAARCVMGVQDDCEDTYELLGVLWVLYFYNIKMPLSFYISFIVLFRFVGEWP